MKLLSELALEQEGYLPVKKMIDTEVSEDFARETSLCLFSLHIPLKDTGNSCTSLANAHSSFMLFYQ